MVASKQKDADTTALAPVTQGYPALVDGGGERAAALRENLGGDKIGVSDLNRIKVPAGGGLQWAVATPEGERSVERIEGIVVAIERRRTYWAGAVTGSPPDCYSVDCETGIGNPGGNCEKCPLNQFGTSKKADGTPGRGKACKESRLFFVLRPGEVLPDVVIVPPGSFKIVRPFLTRLPRHYRSYVMSLGLGREKNRDGIAYSQVVPTVVRQLDPAEAAAVETYARGLRAMLSGIVLDASDVQDD